MTTASDEQVVAAPEPTAAAPAAADPTADNTTAPSTEPTTVSGPAPQPPKREWSMPKNPVTRRHVDAAGRVALGAGTALAKLCAAIGRGIARIGRVLLAGIETVPPALRNLALVAVLMLLGIVGALAGGQALALMCTVVVVPVCAIMLGALGHRWFAAGRPAHSAEAVSDSELQRSVEYIDKKLTLALNAFGAERNQSAMIALFQAKTAIELTLGTEQDTAPVESLLAIDDHTARPRIRAGAKSALRDSNSLAAS
ncbi:hypothetical protein [Mycobacterium sp. C31M]